MIKQFKVKVNKKEYLVEVDEVAEVVASSYEDQKASEEAEKNIEAVLGKEDSSSQARPAVSYEPGTKCGIKAPLPGVIIEVLTKVGKTVKAGDKVLVLEAMKMENALLAPASGKIERIDAKVGESVIGGQPLLTIIC